MKHWLLAGLAAVALAAPACRTSHTVEIKPIHITMDINIKVEQQIQKDFAFMDEGAKPKSEK